MGEEGLPSWLEVPSVDAAIGVDGTVALPGGKEPDSLPSGGLDQWLPDVESGGEQAELATGSRMRFIYSRDLVVLEGTENDASL